MNYETFISRLNEEIKIASVNKRTLFCLLNHFYGCVSVLEMLAQNEINLPIETPFEEIGKEYGFYKGETATTYGASEPYRIGWLWIWNEFGVGQKLEDVDKLEDDTFKIMTEAEDAAGMNFFKTALASQELPEEDEKAVEELLAASGPGLAAASGPGLADASGVASSQPLAPTQNQPLATIKYIPASGKAPASGTAQLPADPADEIVLHQRKKHRITRRHRAITPMVHKRITAITHRRKQSTA